MSRNHEVPGWKKVTAATAAALGMFSLTACNEAPAPAPSVSATEANPNSNEAWADRVATVEKYPTIEEAAAYLMGDSDGTGLYSEILSRAGQRGEENLDGSYKVPAEALEALFGPEPTGGYSAGVVGMIAQLNEYYDRFVVAYRTAQQIDPKHPIVCTTTFTNVEKVSNDTIKGRASMTCENVSLLAGTEEGSWDWSAGLSLALDQQEVDGRKTWVITDANDAE